MLFPQKLDALMQQNGLTRYRLAKTLDIAQSTVSNWLDGRSFPRRATMKQLAAVFGVSPESLTNNEETPTANDERLLPADFTARYLQLSEQARAELDRYAQYLLTCETGAVDPHGKG